MCGIAGFLQNYALTDEAEAIATAMGRAIAHRGPDHAGLWLDREGGLALAHQRLAILDLSESGHQPMMSASGRFVVSFNGEIYNLTELRAQLTEASRPHWRGTSDTEVLVAAIDCWGTRGALDRLNGMFAFAAWDRKERILTLARDRMGEKPLYYGRSGGVFLFGSELKAIRAHPAFDATLDRNALTSMLRHDYVPAPLTIWKEILKLPAAHYVEIAKGGASLGEPVPYWSLERCAAAGLERPVRDDRATEDELEQLLDHSVGLRMVSDVTLGAFLSGGIDSSLVVALMQAQASRPVRTFTIGFDDAQFDEAPKARQVATHLGTEHTELRVTPADALAVVPSLPRIWDEPFGDSSQIPSFLLSELSRRSVTVALSGDGADELFGGYERYWKVDGLWRRLRAVPLSARRPLAAAFASIAGVSSLGHDSARACAILCAETIEELYHWRVSRIERPERLLRESANSAATSVGFPRLPQIPTAAEKMMYIDSLTYLPEDILTKVDRASMAVSLEVRAPFLDHRVAEFAWRLQPSQRLGPTGGKSILRAIARRYLPETITLQGKMGFSVPIAAWLRGPLRDWAEALLDPARLARQGNLDVRAVRALWDGFVSGKRRRDRLVWNLLMFQAWLAEQ